MLTIHAVAQFAADNKINFDPTDMTTNIRALLIGVLGVVFIWISVVTALGPGKSGNTRKSADVVFASMIALVPGAIGLAGIGLAIGAAIFNWAIPGLSS